MSSTKSLALAAGLLLGGAASCFAQSEFNLYGVTFFNNQLIKVDPATGQGSLVGSLGSGVSPYGVANRLGTLYTFSPSDSTVRPIDPNTGLAGAGISIGLSGKQGEGDIAFRSDGIGFLSSALDSDFNPVNDLYRFDISSGTSTRIGSTTAVLDGMVFDGNTLYAIAQGQPDLYTVDQNTGALASVGPLGAELNSPFAGLAISPDGTLLASINDRLFQIDKATGAASPVDSSVVDFGYSSVSGLAVTTVPEPSVWAMLALGGAGFFAARRQSLRRRKS